MRYYIDPTNGNDSFDGCSPERARRSYKDLEIKAGDYVLFKRGSFIRGTLDRVSGEKAAPVTYGAYGEGNAPVFCGSIDVSSRNEWTEIRENIWRLNTTLPSECANFVYDFGRIGATLRWHEKELSSQGDFYDSNFGNKCEGEHTVLLYSKGNPGEVYSHIECVVFGARLLSQNKDHTVCEDLCFFGSGVHALSGGCRDMTVRRCSFLFIGGAVWNSQLGIRFGNAIEFWEYGEDILIENCYFNNIYDSCITEQGSAGCESAKITMRNNLFIGYGMGAYEGRDVMLVDSVFENNICVNAGGGFSAFGDTTPRNSEIYPQPMGHHLFMWRIPRAADNGSFVIRGNSFYNASGAAMYSICSPDADAQMKLENNVYYTENDALLNRIGGKNYSSFGEYMSDYDENGAKYVSSPDIERECEEWFVRSGCGRYTEKLLTDSLPNEKYFTAETEKDPTSYLCGEDICFKIRLFEGKKQISCPKILLTRSGDDGISEKVVLDGENAEYHTSMNTPGQAIVSVTAVDENGECIEDCKTCAFGVAVELDKISVLDSGTATADKAFDEACVDGKINIEKSEFACGDPGDIVYDVKISSGENTASGYLRLPRNAVEGELPIIIEYSDNVIKTAPIPKKHRAIQLSLNIDGGKNGMSDGYYEAIGEKTELDFNGLKRIMSRALLALRYSQSLPEWDGKNIKLCGDGIGACQAIFVSALSGNECELDITTPTDIRDSIFAPHLFASRLHGRVSLTAELGKKGFAYSAAIYNAIKAEKELIAIH